MPRPALLGFVVFCIVAGSNANLGLALAAPECNGLNLSKPYDDAMFFSHVGST